VKITKIESRIYGHDMPKMGYSQAWFTRRSCHLVRVETDEGLVGIGECFGAGNVALGNKAIVEQVIQPLLLGEDPIARQHLWHKVYNALRDHGQKGMPLQAQSAVDIALWDIAGQATGLPLVKLLGGPCRDAVTVYGYGMMLREEEDLESSFAEEAAAIAEMGFKCTKMKIGMGPKKDVKLIQAVRDAIPEEMGLGVDANHAYVFKDAMYVGAAMDEMEIDWFEEPVANEDHQGYRDLCQALKTPVSGGEAEFTRWGFRDLIENRCVDIVQPEVCGLGGITEYLNVLALAHTHFIPCMNHCWGSDVSVAMTLHLLCAQQDLPGGLFPQTPMLEFDSTVSHFRDEILEQPLDIFGQVKRQDGKAKPPMRPGLGVTVNWDAAERYRVA
jgi:D-galactarolactone cycloisomerase